METKYGIITAAEASKYLRTVGLKCSPTMIRDGIKSHTFPFGDYIPTQQGKGRCIIYTKLLENWITEHFAA